MGRWLRLKGLKVHFLEKCLSDLNVEFKDNEISVSPATENENVKALWGLYRVLIDNMVIGVSKGYRKDLEIHGVGYKAEMKGKDLNISARFFQS